MLRFWLRRLIQALPVIAGVITLVFLLSHLVPGDPVDLMLGELASTSDRLALRSKLGLDHSILQQYLSYLSGLAHGSMGESISRQQPVMKLVASRAWPSALLAICSLGVACLLAFPLAFVAVFRRGRTSDTAIMGLSMLGMSVPIFVVAPVLVLLFSIKLRWLPVSGSGSALHLIMPAFCLGLVLSGSLVRMIRASMLDVVEEDYVRTARAKGLSWPWVLCKHALRNAALPVVTLLGNMLGGLLAGAVLTETLFDYAGLGKLFLQAFKARDYPLIQGIVLWIAIAYVLINIFIDALYSVLDPRVRPT